MPTALDIVTGALQEINVVAQGESANPGDAQFALTKLNRLLDAWAARKAYLYDVSFPTYTLVPNLNPHTIGPVGQITQTSLNGNVATYVVPNNFTNGESVTVAGTSNGDGALNITGNVQAATASQFSLPLIHANISIAADSGTVVPAGTAVPTFPTPSMGPRPQMIESATLILTDATPAVELPLAIWDQDQWMQERVKALTTNVPVALYYDPNYPNGSLYLWPVPSYAYGIRLKLWGVIPQFPSLSYAFSLPPGYWDAVVMTLARDMAGSFGAPWTQQLEATLQRSMKAIETNNIPSPKGITADAGMPGVQLRGDFNYYSGMPN